MGSSTTRIGPGGSPLRLLLIILIAATFFMAPMHVAASEPSLLERSNVYRDTLAGLRLMQNSDGGFGRATFPDDNSTSVTEPTHASFLETVLVVHLLNWEKADRLDTWRNWERIEVSLAASNATTALGWLQRYEATHGDDLTPGDRALLAMAYHELGDDANAERLLVRVITKHQESGEGMRALDAARVLVAERIMDTPLDEQQNATIASLRGGLANMDLSGSPEALAWALLADSEQAQRRSQLAGALDEGSITLRALAAWALAASGGPDAITEVNLIATYRAAPVGLAGAFYLLAERTAHPEFSPHAPLLSGGSALGAGSESRMGRLVSQPEPTWPPAPPTGSDLAPIDGEASRFPLPTWFIALTLLAAIMAIVLVKLAYGLKREDLTGTRREIFTYIEKHPGEHFSKIRRDLNLAPGTFQHHLSVLESEGWITSFKEPRYKRYFVNGSRYKQIIAGYQYRQKFAALANDTTRDLVRFIHQHPGATQKEVAERLNLHASTVNWHAKRLQQAGLLNPERSGREVRYHVDEDIVQKMMQAAA